MGEVTSVADDALTHCQRILSDNGLLAASIPGFVSRDIQIQLASAITEAVSQKSVLVAEAGTGTGKTFAYLIPCLLSGKKVLIATATKTLQDQLFQKDLPLLIQALKVSVRIQNLKGRANYICRYRVALYTEEGQFQTPLVASELIYIREKIPQLHEGERNELPEINEDSPVWPYATSTTDNCLGGECSHYADCFLVKARKRALDAQVVVINHHLFFADSRLKQEGVTELLPGVDAVIFDEAHQLPDIATQFHGERVGTRQLRDLMDDVLREWPVLDLPNQPLKQLSHHLDNEVAALWHALSGQDDRVGFDDVMRLPLVVNAWRALQALLAEWALCFAAVDEEASGLIRCRERLDALQSILQQFENRQWPYIRWLERFKQHVVFHATPYDIKDMFQTLLSTGSCGYVFTSATLTVSQSFDSFMSQLGIVNAKTLLLASPFDYQRQAMLYLPRGLPDPKDGKYYDCLLKPVLQLIEACQGRCFLLFTSHKAVKEMARLLAPCIDFPLLIQGQEAKPILLAKFREYGNAVLLGTSTFWEGVDVKGDALSCVVIDKLPFASPHDPVIRGKMAYLKAQGISGFDALSLPAAVLMLKQGVGRLIRDEQDKGVLMIADPRLTAREYGRVMFASLPNMRKSRSESTVLEFIESLGIHHECSGT